MSKRKTLILAPVLALITALAADILGGSSASSNPEVVTLGIIFVGVAAVLSLIAGSRA